MTQKTPTLLQQLKQDSADTLARAKKNRAEFVKGIAALAPTIKALEAIGASAYVSGDDINVSLTGDAAKLALAVRALREAGYSFNHHPSDNGSWCSYFRKEGALTVWLSFSSSVCTLVKVGTKLVEQPVYEMRCAGPDISVEEAVTL